MGSNSIDTRSSCLDQAKNSDFVGGGKREPGGKRRELVRCAKPRSGFALPPKDCGTRQISSWSLLAQIVVVLPLCLFQAVQFARQRIGIRRRNVLRNMAQVMR